MVEIAKKPVDHVVYEMTERERRAGKRSTRIRSVAEKRRAASSAAEKRRSQETRPKNRRTEQEKRRTASLTEAGRSQPGRRDLQLIVRLDF
ncbi:hypothetical protein NDU88_001724 [Pleurodeles waltl]|uniref:Uncharacterized protein n=1 Tax=Pleurodeles waltl TaxID=8319 RepID=A0AAV7MPJ7_PLEWA|nr:hypothetical protein NDU88_001724 [Pleurodeles waltl]